MRSLGFGPLIDRCDVVGRPWGADFYPVFEDCDLLVGELSVRRHLEFARLPDGLDQQALVRLARHDGGAALAAFEHRLARIEPQIIRVLFVAVALAARGDQQGTHLLLEELELRGRLGQNRRCG